MYRIEIGTIDGEEGNLVDLRPENGEFGILGG